MKILFLYPNAGSQPGFSYGLAQLSAILKEAGHTVRVWQLCEALAPLPTPAEFAARLRTEAPELVGFSVVTNQWAYAAELACLARAAVPAARLVCGGVHATVATADVLRAGLFDYVLRGECDTALPAFVEALARGESPEGLPHVAFLRDGQPVLNPLRPLPDLASLPPLDYEAFEFQRLIDAKQGWVGLMASRGCPFACTYCFNHRLVEQYRRDLGCSAAALNYIRRLPVSRLLAEVARVRAGYRNIRMFIFDDDLFTLDPAWVAEFCAAYRAACPVPFVVNAHVLHFDDARAAALAGAGCRIVKFGIESGSPRLREQVLNRHMSDARIVAALAAAHRHGLHSSVFVMIGLPHETEEDLLATVRLLAAAWPGRFRWSFFFPYPGTRADEVAVRGGFVNEQKRRLLRNFTGGSCLEFGAAHDLLLEKVGAALPWWVNAASGLPAAALYAERVRWLQALPRAEWERVRPGLAAEDAALSRQCVAAGWFHYALRYNAFMGVSSEYFLREGEGESGGSSPGTRGG